MNETIYFFLLLPNNKMISLESSANITIYGLKRICWEETVSEGGSTWEYWDKHVYVVMGARTYTDNKTLKEIGVVNESIIKLFVRMFSCKKCCN